MFRAIELLGLFVMAFFAEVGKLSIFFVRTFQAMLTPPFYAKQIPVQMYQIGIKSLPVLLTVSTFVGMTLAVQGDIAFRQVGATGLLGLFCALAEFRELCPIMAAAMVCAKAGSQMAANLGTMRVKEQIDAMEVMAVDPIGFLIVPRLLACLLVMPLMVIVANLTAIAASYFVAVYQLHQDGSIFLAQVVTYVTPFDVIAGLFKGLAFGSVISVICCYYGFYATRGAEGVGQATNRAVVYSATVCVILNLFLTEILYG